MSENYEFLHFRSFPNVTLTALQGNNWTDFDKSFLILLILMSAMAF